MIPPIVVRVVAGDWTAWRCTGMNAGVRSTSHAPKASRPARCRTRLLGGAGRCDRTRAAAQGPQQPGVAAPRLRRGLSHPARPVFDAADVGESLGPVDLLDLAGEVIVHAPNVWLRHTPPHWAKTVFRSIPRRGRQLRDSRGR